LTDKAIFTSLKILCAMGGFYTIFLSKLWTVFDGWKRFMRVLQVALHFCFLNAPLKSFFNSLATNFTTNHALGTLPVLNLHLKPQSA